MKLREIMTSPVIRIHPEETVAVAARTMERYNIGAVPVCGSDGRMCGLVTDRDLVTRCLAAQERWNQMTVREVMTASVVTARADMEVSAAAELMGRQQIRRLPVVENGKLCGMVSLGDLTKAEESAVNAGEALAEISSGLSRRE